MRIVDAHVHLYKDPDVLRRLLAAMDACGIERSCLSGLGSLFDLADNEQVHRAIRAYPDRLIGAVYVRPGVDAVDTIDWAAGEGFRMMKVSLPKSGYDDPAYYPLWARAAHHQMPVLFHTGIVATAREAPEEGISSWFMHPMRLEPVSRTFPDLPIILAHLGVAWNQEAAELARMRPNVYVDLTGEPRGWRMRADREGMDKYLWWPGAFGKVVFGTDVRYEKIPQILEEDQRRCDRLGIEPGVREQIFSGNILRMLGE